MLTVPLFMEFSGTCFVVVAPIGPDLSRVRPHLGNGWSK